MSGSDIIDTTYIKAEPPPAVLNTEERSALLHARARLRAMIDRRNKKLDQLMEELNELRIEMRQLDTALDKVAPTPF